MITHNSISTFSPALPSAVDNQASVWFRLIDVSTVSASGGTVGGAGTDRVDNFIVAETVVPEPSTWLAGLLLALPFGVRGIRYVGNRKQA